MRRIWWNFEGLLIHNPTAQETEILFHQRLFLSRNCQPKRYCWYIYVYFTVKSGKTTHSLQALAGSLISSEDETERRSEHASPELKYPPTEEAPLASGQETPKLVLMSNLPSGLTHPTQYYPNESFLRYLNWINLNVLKINIIYKSGIKFELCRIVIVEFRDRSAIGNVYYERRTYWQGFLNATH